MTVGWSEPLSIVSEVFYDVPLSNATLHVPVGTADKYREAETWEKFGTIQEYEVSGISFVESGNLNVESRKFIQNGRMIIQNGDKRYGLDGKEL